MAIPQTEILITVNGSERGRYLCEPGEYILGRNADCQLVVEADLVSRRHAKLTINFDHAFIEDLGSSNGTQVNGKPAVGNTRLWPNQKIQIGAATIELRRIKVESTPDMTLTPTGEVMRRVLPEAFLREKKYDIGGVIAQGGMGAILNAREATTERTVAMKVMLNTNSPDDLLRFLTEAKITAQLEHPNVVPVHELSVDENGQVFYTMKMVKGITLRKVLDQLAKGASAQCSVPSAQNSDPSAPRETEHCELSTGHYSLAVLLTVFQKVCDALAFAHSKGVIHRDLKPENIMIGDFGEVLLMDWGLAKQMRNGECGVRNEEAGAAALEHSALRIPHSEFGATLSGTVMGTPQFMAPEQARGEVETLDARSDIYALGGILYQILSLRIAVTGKDAMEVVGKVGRGEIEPLHVLAQRRKDAKADKNGDAQSSNFASSRLCASHLPGGRIPDGLAAVVRKGMAFDREARYRSVPDLQKDIEAYQNGFATGAENAGMVRQLRLLVLRHRALFATGFAAWLIITALVVWFVVNVTREKRVAQDALANLAKTAPTFLSLSKELVQRENFADALEKIGYALSLDANNPTYHAQRGNILQSMERFPEAAEAYAAALRLNPQEPHAAANIELSRTLAAAREKDGTLAINTRIQWRDALIQQGRAAEAVFAGRGAGTDVQKMLPLWQAKIDGWLGKNAPKVVFNFGVFNLDLQNLSLTDLSPLRDIPVQSLIISRNPHIKDLSPLANCPITNLRATDIPDLTDLSPLKGMKLKLLIVSGTGVRDLSPLAGMLTLEALQISHTGVTDLTPIREARLKSFGALNTKIHSLEPLRGHPLELLSLQNVHFESLDPVGDAPLVELSITTCGHQDLALLRTRTLRKFSAAGTTCDHLEVLGEMANLEYITCPANMTDFSVLRKLPRLGTIVAPGKPTRDAADFWREYDAKQAAAKK